MWVPAGILPHAMDADHAQRRPQTVDDRRQMIPLSTERVTALTSGQPALQGLVDRHGRVATRGHLLCQPLRMYVGCDQNTVGA